MNIQLIVNGVDLNKVKTDLNWQLNEHNVRALCGTVKDAFPLVEASTDGMSFQLTYNGCTFLIAVKTEMMFKVYVYNCMRQDLPYMVEAECCKEAWSSICEHLLQTRLNNILEPIHVLGVIENRVNMANSQK